MFVASFLPQVLQVADGSEKQVQQAKGHQIAKTAVVFWHSLFG